MKNNWYKKLKKIAVISNNWKFFAVISIKSFFEKNFAVISKRKKIDFTAIFFAIISICWNFKIAEISICCNIGVDLIFFENQAFDSKFRSYVISKSKITKISKGKYNTIIRLTRYTVMILHVCCLVWNKV